MEATPRWVACVLVVVTVPGVVAHLHFGVPEFLVPVVDLAMVGVVVLGEVARHRHFTADDGDREVEANGVPDERDGETDGASDEREDAAV